MSIVLDPAMDPRDHGKEPGTWSNKCKEKRHWVMAVVTAKQQAFLREGLGLSFVLGLHHPMIPGMRCSQIFTQQYRIGFFRA